MPLSRRKRLILLTAALAAVFVTASGVGVWHATRPEAGYRPGGPVNGLTSGLARRLPPDHPRITFSDVTREAGIAFRHFDGVRTSQIPEDMGSGAAWGDFDRDGWIDLFVVNTVGPISLTDSARRRSDARSVLYRNNGDGSFSDVTDRAGIDHRAWGMGAAWADYDDDGWLDLVVTAYGETTLYRNEGGRFSDRTRAAGLNAGRGFWTGASWGDYDRDGHVDLYITGYVRFAGLEAAGRALDVRGDEPASINPNSFPPERNLLYHNNGNGTFTETAAAAGVIDSLGKGLSASWCDFDEDGWPDLYVANDVSDNVLFRNRGDGTFEDVSHAARVADYRSAMGLAVGDWDGDGDQDLFITHWLAQENALYNNQLSRLRAAATSGTPPLQFMDAADRYGLGQIALDFVGWGTSFLDYDNDGRLDLFVVNGGTHQRRDDPTRLVPMADQLFWNRGPQEGFYDVSAVSGPFFQETLVGRGAAFADYDNDGDLDAFVVNNGGPAILLRNEGGNRAHWLQVELQGTRSNPQGRNARIRLVVGGRAQVREVGAQSSYLSQNSLIEHFGLGEAAMADTLEVLWPGGARQVRTGIPAGQRLLVVEGGSPGDSLAAGRRRTAEFWERYRAGDRYRLAGRPDSAAALYTRALESQPDHQNTLYNLGNVQLELGDFAAAERTWRRLAEVEPASARARSQLGNLRLCLELGAPFDPARAEAEFAAAHALNREETGPVLQLGEAALMRDDLATARRRFRAVLGSHGGSVAARFYLGYLDWADDDPDPASPAGARAEAPAREPPGASNEGDVRRGSVRVPARPARCAGLRALTWDLERLDSAARGPETEKRYRELDRLRSEARARLTSRVR